MKVKLTSGLDRQCSHQQGKAEQYRVSHVTTFGGKTTTVPDGGATLILLGAALSGLGAARRFMKS